ncbi:MAG: TatD family hydrolase [Turicibacter sp.]|nr:TatD family hydrolase [Turicibacter sp.]
MLFDTHVHLNDKKYASDLLDVIERAKHEGVTNMLVVGYDQYSNKRAIELAEQYDFIYASVGWHPVDSIYLTEELFAELVEQAKHSKVVAIGECGLDYHWDTSPIDIQKEVFIRQIKLAQELNKPLVIHTRESIADTLEVLELSHASIVGGVMHCYSGSVEMAHQFINLNFKISLGGPVTFTNGRRPQSVAKEIPLEYLLVETDAPYLAPHPYRGKRNEPFYVSLVARKIAELKNLSYEYVCEQTLKNACDLFKIK